MTFTVSSARMNPLAAMRNSITRAKGTAGESAVPDEGWLASCGTDLMADARRTLRFCSEACEAALAGDHMKGECQAIFFSSARRARLAPRRDHMKGGVGECCVCVCVRARARVRVLVRVRAFMVGRC